MQNSVSPGPELDNSPTSSTPLLLSSPMASCQAIRLVYKCDQCQAALYTQNDVNAHKFKHEQEPLYECSMCNQKKTRSVLQNHRQYHERECDLALRGNACFEKNVLVQPKRNPNTSFDRFVSRVDESEAGSTETASSGFPNIFMTQIEKGIPPGTFSSIPSHIKENKLSSQEISKHVSKCEEGGAANDSMGNEVARSKLPSSAGSEKLFIQQKSLVPEYTISSSEDGEETIFKQPVSLQGSSSKNNFGTNSASLSLASKNQPEYGEPSKTQGVLQNNDSRKASTDSAIEKPREVIPDTDADNPTNEQSGISSQEQIIRQTKKLSVFETPNGVIDVNQVVQKIENLKEQLEALCNSGSALSILKKLTQGDNADFTAEISYSEEPPKSNTPELELQEPISNDDPESLVHTPPFYLVIKANKQNNSETPVGDAEPEEVNITKENSILVQEQSKNSKEGISNISKTFQSGALTTTGEQPEGQTGPSIEESESMHRIQTSEILFEAPAVKTASKPSNETPADHDKIEHAACVDKELKVIEDLLPQLQNQWPRSGQFSCIVCGKIFLRRHDRDLHLYQGHENELIYGCVLCKKEFTHISELTQHSRDNICRPGSPVVKEADCGLKKEGDNLLFKNNESKMSIEETSRKEDTVVETEAQENTGQKCFYCQIHFPDSDRNRAHEHSHFLSCLGCNSIFLDKEKLEKHVALHYQKLEFQCNDCPSSFKSLPSLLNHISQHAYQCHLCQVTLPERRLFRQHLSHHNSREKGICHTCGNDLEPGSNVQPRCSDYNSKKSYFECYKCNASFGELEPLYLHERLHTFACSMCSLILPDNERLIQHLKDHILRSSESPNAYALENQRKKGKYRKKGRANLQGEYNYSKTGLFSCFVCSRKIQGASTLISHENTHLRFCHDCKKPTFSCNYPNCNKMFNNKRDFNAHKEDHAAGNVELVVAAAADTGGEMAEECLVETPEPSIDVKGTAEQNCNAISNIEKEPSDIDAFDVDKYILEATVEPKRDNDVNRKRSLSSIDGNKGNKKCRYASENQYACPSCMHVFKNTEQLHNHWFQVGGCSEEFSAESTSQKEYKYSLFQCWLCNESLDSKSQLREHYNVHFKCSRCNGMFFTEGSLREHEICHNEEKSVLEESIHHGDFKKACVAESSTFKYICFCNESFARKVDLLVHKRTHEYLGNTTDASSDISSNHGIEDENMNDEDQHLNEHTRPEISQLSEAQTNPESTLKQIVEAIEKIYNIEILSKPSEHDSKSKAECFSATQCANSAEEPNSQPKNYNQFSAVLKRTIEEIKKVSNQPKPKESND